MKFALPNDVYGFPTDSGWDRSTYSRFSAKLTYTWPTSPENTVTVPMTCAMWKSQDHVATAYDQVDEGKKVRL